ncbi:MAG: hypothetical protein ACLSVD_09600 [Eggerthellaceae bacterium]
MPVIETGTGNCHVYVHESADYDKARHHREREMPPPRLCNAAETLLVDEAAAEGFLPAALASWRARRDAARRRARGPLARPAARTVPAGKPTGRPSTLRPTWPCAWSAASTRPSAT